MKFNIELPFFPGFYESDLDTPTPLIGQSRMSLNTITMSTAPSGGLAMNPIRTSMSN